VVGLLRVLFSLLRLIFLLWFICMFVRVLLRIVRLCRFRKFILISLSVL